MINFETTQYTGSDDQFTYDVYSTKWGWSVNKWPTAGPKIPPMISNLSQDGNWTRMSSNDIGYPGAFPTAEAVFEILNSQRLYALTK
jgi:hypothetical protein